jgi:hypothetical protein
MKTCATPSAVDHALRVFGVSLTLCVQLRVLDLVKFVRGQLDVCGGEMLLEPVALVVPGIGTIHGFWASSQASAIWCGPAPPLLRAGAISPPPARP